MSATLLQLDPARRCARAGPRQATLNRQEFAVLSRLHEAAGRTVSHECLLAAAWPPHTSPANLRVAIRSLRRKLEADAQLPTLILTVPGEGYRLGDGA